MKKIAYLSVIAMILFSMSVFALTRGVSIINWQYEPSNLTIGTGMTVIWTNNEDSSTHRVNIREISKSSQLMYPGDSFNFTFDDAGTYSFYDAASPVRLKGSINVILKEEYTYCGDGICNEDKEICCKDCGCDAEYYCFNNVCVKNETTRTKEPEITGQVTKESTEEPKEEIIEEHIEEIKPTNYTPLIFGSIIVIAVLSIFVLVRKIAKNE